MARRAADTGDEVPVGLVEWSFALFRQQVGEADDGVQRGAELMTNAGQELTLPAGSPRQLRVGFSELAVGFGELGGAFGDELFQVGVQTPDLPFGPVALGLLGNLLKGEAEIRRHLVEEGDNIRIEEIGLGGVNREGADELPLDAQGKGSVRAVPSPQSFVAPGTHPWVGANIRAHEMPPSRKAAPVGPRPSGSSATEILMFWRYPSSKPA